MNTLLLAADTPTDMTGSSLGLVILIAILLVLFSGGGNDKK